MTSIAQKGHLLSTICIIALASGAYAQGAVQVGMDASGWIRRDWDECAGASKLIDGNGLIEIRSDTSAALFWQIPTREGRPLAIDRNRKWIRECDRPPSYFGDEVIDMDRDRKTLLQVTDFPNLSWKWRVSKTMDDSRTANRKGRIQQAGDDFSAKLGVSILKKGSDDLREIAYVWTRMIPEESLIYQERRILFWKHRYHRIVAESGDEHTGSWVSETRSLYDDYKRIYPDEEPGRIVRIYLMTDSDDTRDRVSSAFSNIRFHR